MSDSAEEPRRVIVKSSAEDATEACAKLFRRMASQCVEARGTFCVSLAGGTTPYALYERLARQATSEHMPWGELQVFFGDERDVPHDHVESNFRMTQRTLLDHVPIPLGRVHPMPADAQDLDAAAAEYEKTIRRIVPAGGQGTPRFDLILLGMGADGHTASLFPHTAALTEQDKLVAAQFVPVLGRYRMTFTFPLINAAQDVILLVTGDDKGEAVEELLSGGADPQKLPAAGVSPTDGRLTFVFDAAAGRRAGLRAE
jgi:6-phosphogluconolactonase